jgi:hypothetical protein
VRRTPNLQKPSGDFHSNPLVNSVLSQLQGSNSVIPKSFACAWIMWNQCSLDVSHSVIPSECNPNLADPAGLWVIIPFPIWNSLLDSHRTVDADSFSEQLAQSMKRLSATMIPNSRVLPLLCAPNGRSLIDTRDTCAVCESPLGSNKES